MHWFTSLMLFVVVWWLVFFAVLPFGVRPLASARDVPGGFRGVPTQPRLGRKALITTLFAALVWGGCMTLIRSDILSFRTGWLADPAD